MKKAEQIEVNNFAESVCVNVSEYVNSYRAGCIGQLRSCAATVYYYNRYFILKSYNTIVAAITPDDECVDFLRYVYGYTATSAQHIAKFFADYAPKDAPRYTWREV